MEWTYQYTQSLYQVAVKPPSLGGKLSSFSGGVFGEIALPKFTMACNVIGVRIKKSWGADVRLHDERLRC